MKNLKWFGLGVFLLAILSAIIYISTFLFSSPDGLTEDKYVIIPTGADYTDVLISLQKAGVYVNEPVFNSLSKQLKYTDKVKAGRYKIEKESTPIDIIRKLRSGNQEPVEVTIYRENTPENLAAKIASYLEFDSTAYLQVFKDDELLNKYNLDSTSFMTLVIPNTYFIYYNTSPEGIFKRLLHEHDEFWKREDRKEKAADLGMSEEEVYTLASIVERESQYKPERARIAGVYLNRLEKGIPLQADPTVLFALNRPETRRVLKVDLEIDSPYNTYKYGGLPPGPIGTASISSIDAVLNYEKHDYFYFCAKPDNTGQHAFAKTLTMHIQNARKFHRWLNNRGIHR